MALIIRHIMISFVLGTSSFVGPTERLMND